jgi:hypothetical protein
MTRFRLGNVLSRLYAGFFVRRMVGVASIRSFQNNKSVLFDGIPGHNLFEM